MKAGRPKKEHRKVKIQVYVEPEIEAQIRAEAEEKSFSTSSYLSGMITAAFKA